MSATDTRTTRFDATAEAEAGATAEAEIESEAGVDVAGPARTGRERTVIAGAVVALVAIAVAAVASVGLPDLPGGSSVAMTHYMELLSTNQPWNLVLFMVIPVALAETLAVTELAVLLRRTAARPAIRAVNRWAGIVVGIYFLGVFFYLLAHAVVPLTRDGGWRGLADVVAVGGYLSGVVPLFGIALLELNVIGRRLDPAGRRRLHAWFVGLFLVVAHLAMIFGMLDPTVLGWHTPGHAGMHM
jgi:hypothetical protein